ncbi:uncharacterized protein LOC122205519 [Panthera leo]|uniref:uncharacterized protein LOC122205519 n=1 Tax=Panthera leo TaxID=9689 RepID=UPI001C6A3A8C|nr:uncharacterized protein LOC122205519 [Panthera leo]
MQGQGAENVTAADVPRRTRAGGACWPPTDTRRLAAFSHRSPRVASPRILPRRGPHLHSQANPVRGAGRELERRVKIPERKRRLAGQRGAAKLLPPPPRAGGREGAAAAGPQADWGVAGKEDENPPGKEKPTLVTPPPPRWRSGVESGSSAWPWAWPSALEAVTFPPLRPRVTQRSPERRWGTDGASLGAAGPWGQKCVWWHAKPGARSREGGFGHPILLGPGLRDPRPRQEKVAGAHRPVGPEGESLSPAYLQPSPQPLRTSQARRRLRKPQEVSPASRRRARRSKATPQLRSAVPCAPRRGSQQTRAVALTAAGAGEAPGRPCSDPPSRAACSEGSSSPRGLGCRAGHPAGPHGRPHLCARTPSATFDWRSTFNSLSHRIDGFLENSSFDTVSLGKKYKKQESGGRLRPGCDRCS